MTRPASASARRDPAGFVPISRSKMIDIGKFEKTVPPRLVEAVAKAIINADIDQFGGAWPWPTGHDASDVEARENARAVAIVAIQAFVENARK